MFISIRLKKLRLTLIAALLLVLVLFFVVGGSLLTRASVPAAAGAVGNLPTIVIDPGHGGADGGASSASGILESALNLEIAERVEAIFLFFGLPVRMTRSSETIDYPPDAQSIKAKKTADTKARVQLIESTEHALLLSIHQNYYPASGPCGAQALYAPTSGSQELAERIQANILTFLDPENRRPAAPIQDSIYIMNHVSCPAVLVECGFLSNPEETEKLCTKEYQIKLAAVLAASILPQGGIHEGKDSILLHGVRQ